MNLLELRSLGRDIFARTTIVSASLRAFRIAFFLIFLHSKHTTRRILIVGCRNKVIPQFPQITAIVGIAVQASTPDTP